MGFRSAGSGAKDFTAADAGSYQPLAVQRPRTKNSQEVEVVVERFNFTAE